MGYLLHRPYWGQGYATEGAAGCIAYGLETLKCRRIVALIQEVNLPSQAVARRLGMSAAGESIHAGLPHLVYATRKAPAAAGNQPLAPAAR